MNYIKQKDKAVLLQHFFKISFLTFRLRGLSYEEAAEYARLEIVGRESDFHDFKKA